MNSYTYWGLYHWYLSRNTNIGSLQRPSNIIWGVLLAWNVLGRFDLIGAIVLTFIVPYEPFPEIGLNTFGFRAVFTLNTIIQISSIYLLFTSELFEYFDIK